MTQGTNTDVSSGHNNVSTGLQLSYVQQIPNDSQGDNSQYHGSGRSYSSYSQKIDSPAQVYNHSVGFLTSHVPNSQFTQIPSAQCVPATPYNSQFTFVTPSQHGFVSPVNQSVHSTVLVSEGFHQGGTPPAAGHQFASFAGGQAFQAAPSFLSPASVSFVASPGSTQVPGTILTTPVIDGSPTRQDGSCDDRFCGEEEVLVVPQSEQQLSEVVQEIEVSPSSLQEEDLVSLQQQEMVTPSQQEMTTQQEEILVAPCQQPLKDIREFGDLNQSDAYVSEQAVPPIYMHSIHQQLHSTTSHMALTWHSFLTLLIVSFVLKSLIAMASSGKKTRGKQNIEMKIIEKKMRSWSSSHPSIDCVANPLFNNNTPPPTVNTHPLLFRLKGKRENI
ncbi:hypothetical protein V6N11_037875 [Hibiscus sabdariffa]|uniref:Uncharacterized protein n=1 Tax=Hibiscus sabdariffa TaxID=183260 RepID=A0ABR2A785_9ROSI